MQIDERLVRRETKYILGRGFHQRLRVRAKIKELWWVFEAFAGVRRARFRGNKLPPARIVRLPPPGRTLWLGKAWELESPRRRKIRRERRGRVPHLSARGGDWRAGARCDLCLAT